MLKTTVTKHQCRNSSFLEMTGELGFPTGVGVAFARHLCLDQPNILLHVIM